MNESAPLNVNQPRFQNVIPLNLQNQIRRTLFGVNGMMHARKQALQHLFVLGHMRAGSSLLTQILSHHPSVTGYGELFLHYKNRWDLWAMQGKVFAKSQIARGKRPEWVMDKVLHNYLIKDNFFDAVAEHRPAYIFLIRPPRPVIESMIRSFNATETYSFDYYIPRIREIGKYIEQLPAHSAIGITYPQLTNHTEQVFKLIESHLGLPSPLSQEYHVESNAKRVGDQSEKMYTGRVLGNTKQEKPPLELNEETLREAETYYAETKRKMMERCTTISEAAD